MDAATRSKLLKIGGGMVSLGKSFSPEAVGLDLRSLNTEDGDKGDSGGGDNKEEKNPPVPPKEKQPEVPESNPELPKDDKANDFGQAIKLAEGLGPQGLSNASWDQFKFVANSLPKDGVLT